jgi:ribosomal protein S27E|tara:strand:- start:342 stop:566 length:225 start_codon:yes stop_codon:yes gene_type:complete
MVKFFKFKAEVVTGKCPTCEESTMLVSIATDYYRCMTCGADLEQHINGKISYIPAITKKTPQSKIDNIFGNGES